MGIWYGSILREVLVNMDKKMGIIVFIKNHFVVVDGEGLEDRSMEVRTISLLSIGDGDGVLNKEPALLLYKLNFGGSFLGHGWFWKGFWLVNNGFVVVVGLVLKGLSVFEVVGSGNLLNRNDGCCVLEGFGDCPKRFD